MEIDETKQIKLKDKPMMTLLEAAEFTGIGRDKLCKLSNSEDCDFVLRIGRKRLFKRKKLDEYIEKSFSI